MSRDARRGRRAALIAITLALVPTASRAEEPLAPRLAGDALAAVQRSSARTRFARYGRDRPEVGRELGAGSFGRATLAEDGTVHIELRDDPTIFRTWHLDEPTRARLARRSVRAANLLRSWGFPIVKTRLAPDGVTILRAYADGLALDALDPAAREAALRNSHRVAEAAYDALRGARHPVAHEVRVDRSASNFRFDRRGLVLLWFDPVAPVSDAEFTDHLGRD